jgi:membrane protein required for colicin V production
MKLIDILILLPILWGGFIGYQRGIIVEVISIAAFVISVIIGFRMLGVASNWLSPYINDRLTGRILPYVGFGAVFFPIVFLINKLGWTLRKSIRYTVFGSFDSLAGGIVGMFTWAFGISIILWIATSIGIKIPSSETENTYLFPLAKPLAPKVIGKAIEVVPKEIERMRK